MIDEWIERLENELELFRSGTYGDGTAVMRFTHREVFDLLQFMKAYKEAEQKNDTT